MSTYPGLFGNMKDEMSTLNRAKKNFANAKAN